MPSDVPVVRAPLCHTCTPRQVRCVLHRASTFSSRWLDQLSIDGADSWAHGLAPSTSSKCRSLTSFRALHQAPVSDVIERQHDERRSSCWRYWWHQNVRSAGRIRPTHPMRRSSLKQSSKEVATHPWKQIDCNRAGSSVRTNDRRIDAPVFKPRAYMSRARIHTRSSGRTLAYIRMRIRSRARVHLRARKLYDVRAARCRDCKRALHARCSRSALQKLQARAACPSYNFEDNARAHPQDGARGHLKQLRYNSAQKKRATAAAIIRMNDAAWVRHELHSWRKQYRIDVYDWHHRHGWCHRHHPREMSSRGHSLERCPLEVTPLEVYRRDGIHHPIQASL